jgi:hypothetical protein
MCAGSFFLIYAKDKFLEYEEYQAHSPVWSLHSHDYPVTGLTEFVWRCLYIRNSYSALCWMVRGHKIKHKPYVVSLELHTQIYHVGS